MFPMTVTSRHSPGITPDSKVPMGRVKAMPLVVSPSYSELGICHMGAFTYTTKDRISHNRTGQVTTGQDK